MLRLQDLRARMLDLIDRVQSRLIVLGSQINLHQIIVYLIGIFGIREIIQEILEDCHRLAKASESGLVDQ